MLYCSIIILKLLIIIMASFNKGQLPAQQTKVVDHGLGLLKAGPTRLYVQVCSHDAASSKPSSVGKDVVDIHLQTNCDCVVTVCFFVVFFVFFSREYKEHHIFFYNTVQYNME